MLIEADSKGHITIIFYNYMNQNVTSVLQMPHPVDRLIRSLSSKEQQ